MTQSRTSDPGTMSLRQVQRLAIALSKQFGTPQPDVLRFLLRHFLWLDSSQISVALEMLVLGDSCGDATD